MLEGRILTSWEERQQAALPLANGAVQDFRIAVLEVPTEPTFHGDLARSRVDAGRARPPSTARSTSPPLWPASRGPRSWHRTIHSSSGLWRSSQCSRAARSTELGLRAGRTTVVGLDPGLLADLVDQFLLQGLTASQWVALVPDMALDRADLGVLLEQRALTEEAAHAYQGAVEAAPAE